MKANDLVNRRTRSFHYLKNIQVFVRTIMNRHYFYPRNTASGMTVANKLIEVRSKMSEKNATVLIVTALDEVACEFDIFTERQYKVNRKCTLLDLFNLRGSDIPYNPVFYGYAIVTRDPNKLYLITRSQFFNNTIQLHFQEEGVVDELVVVPYENALDTIKNTVYIIRRVPNENS
jgi:hypothetical protein